jgi:hypothetical protein
LFPSIFHLTPFHFIPSSYFSICTVNGFQYGFLISGYLCLYILRRTINVDGVKVLPLSLDATPLGGTDVLLIENDSLSVAGKTNHLSAADQISRQSQKSGGPVL